MGVKRNLSYLETVRNHLSLDGYCLVLGLDGYSIGLAVALTVLVLCLEIKAVDHT